MDGSYKKKDLFTSPKRDKIEFFNNDETKRQAKK